MRYKILTPAALLPCAALALTLYSTGASAQTEVASFTCSTATPRYEIALAGTISRQDFESYVELPFEVPTGVRRLDVAFDYDRGERTTIDLGLLDPQGFRGWSGGNKRTFFVSANAATPSYNTGGD